MKKAIFFSLIFALCVPAFCRAAAGIKNINESGAETGNSESAQVSGQPSNQAQQDQKAQNMAEEENQNQVIRQEQNQNQEQAQIQTQTKQQEQNEGEEAGIMNQQKTQLKIRTANELKEAIKQKKQEMSEEMQGLKEKAQNVYKNQNKVREAVHSLLAMKDMIGGIGPQVSAIAKEFNNSVQSTIKAEEIIQARSRVKKFFIGGDKEAAEKISQEANKNQQRIQELKQLKENCGCDEEIKAVMEEQIRNVEQEQIRLKALAQAEINSKGIFGRLFGWLRK
ncbi:hypothetical protein L6249_00150 [Candidatus Parcubacteria bacterium]|nr:hypothetical protein [Patescibacteria group bacterium]MCG2690473.1 hypothetical protein [Candidatus Parcubacteria bacterium]